MKSKILLFSLIFTAFTSLIFAQERTPKTPEERAEIITGKMEEKLGLSADQKTQIYQINLESAQKTDELRSQVKNQEIGREEFMAEMKTLEQDRDAKIEALLTEAQKPKYEEMKENARQRLKERSQNFRRKRGGENEGEGDIDGDL
ncbi:MAG: DUF4890 domain-containing protein [Microscillaceae bacterium]|nr:DUF4890 domain-containing protein [Microscillaceae bacterium]